MAIGNRIKWARTLRQMTMKQLGLAVGFEENGADVRIAQYENNSRKPKEELLHKIADVLQVDFAYLDRGEPNRLVNFSFDLFEMETWFSDQMQLIEVPAETEDQPNRVAFCLNQEAMQSFFKEWKMRKDELAAGKITKEEYYLWQIGWPRTSDSCGTAAPKQQWRHSK